MNSRTISASLVALLIAGAVLLIWRPWETNWNSTLRWEKKQPFDLGLFHTLLKNREGTSLRTITGPSNKNRDLLIDADLIFYVNSDFNNFKIDLWQEMLDSGKTIVVMNQYANINLLNSLDSLRYDTLENYWNYSFYHQASYERLKFATTVSDSFFVDMPYLAMPYNITGFATEKLKQLNYKFETLFYVDDEVGGIKFKARKGEVYYIAYPQLFSNYFLEKEPIFNLVENISAKWPKGNGVIDLTTYSPPSGTSSGRSPNMSSPLSFIMANTSLKIGWILFLSGIFLFIVFQSKRLVRAIPVIPVKQNKTLEFARTLGQMELRSKNYKKMATNILEEVEAVVRKRFHRKEFDLSHKHWNQLRTFNPTLPTEFDLLPLMKSRLERQSEFTEAELIKLYNSRTAFLNYLDHGRKNG